LRTQVPTLGEGLQVLSGGLAVGFTMREGEMVGGEGD
jgi:hypothetical protein